MRLFESRDLSTCGHGKHITMSVTGGLPDIEAKITNMSAVDRNCVFRCMAQDIYFGSIARRTTAP